MKATREDGVLEMLDMEEERASEARIRVLGIGGAGGNALNRMVECKVKDAELVAVNTDAQALARCRTSEKLQIGSQLTKGLGSGADPEVGRCAAQEDRDKLIAYVRDSDLLFIVAGLGGGTGTGASPLIAELARERGSLTVAVVTKPFLFEGRKRIQQAEAGLEELRNKVDALICISNENLTQLLEGSLTLVEAFRAADDILVHGVEAIANLVSHTGLINLDFADVKTVLERAGPALLGVGIAKGERRASLAAEQAVYSPLLEAQDISGARRVLLNISGGPGLGLKEVKEAADRVCEMADSSANIIFGASIDERLKDRLQVTLIAAALGGPRAARVTKKGQLELPAGVPPLADVPAWEELGSGSGLGAEEEELEVPTFIRRGRVALGRRLRAPAIFRK